jgi:hypothetical protein
MSSFQSQFFINSIPCIRFLDNQETKFIKHVEKWGGGGGGGGGIIRYSSPTSKTGGTRPVIQK